MLDDSRYLCRLGVNVDHVATLRQNRGTMYPDPVAAALEAEAAGAHQITVHLREDRRHIQERDLELLRRSVQTAVNLEMAAPAEMIRFACRIRPDQVTLVPERRQELTTEGGLDAAGQKKSLGAAVRRLMKSNITVSLFIDPDPRQIEAATDIGAYAVELHTGEYANARTRRQAVREFDRLAAAAREAQTSGLRVFAGHGLHYRNTRPVAELTEIEELNIGHSIVARAVFVGMRRAVREMLDTIRRTEPPTPLPPFPPTYRPAA
ncbi:pyridoxine 5'-phosphate synthase [bacterium]|nr:pyridoxine 5'-phosphate synthase [bacterium]